MISPKVSLSCLGIFNHTNECLGAAISRKMPRTRSKAVSEGNGPVFQDKFKSGKSMVEYPQMLKEGFVGMDSQFDKIDDHFEAILEMSKTNQRHGVLHLQI